MSLTEGLLGGGALLAGGMLVNEAYQNMGNVGSQAATAAQGIANDALAQTQFNPYAVTTATGSTFGVDEGGNVSVGLSAQEQAMQDQAMANATNFMGQAAAPNAQLTQDVYDQIRQLQAAGEQQAQMELEQRLFAQGRLGTSSNAYGGATPEMLAMMSAQAQARNQAAFDAMGYADQRQMQNANLANAFMGMGYMPGQQALNAGNYGFNNAQLYQQGQLAGAGMYGEAAMSGLEAQLGAALGQGNLAGNVGAAMLQGSLSSAGGDDGWLGSLFG